MFCTREQALSPCFAANVNVALQHIQTEITAWLAKRHARTRWLAADLLLHLLANASAQLSSIKPQVPAMLAPVLSQAAKKGLPADQAKACVLARRCLVHVAEHCGVSVVRGAQRIKDKSGQTVVASTLQHVCMQATDTADIWPNDDLKAQARELPTFAALARDSRTSAM